MFINWLHPLTRTQPTNRYVITKPVNSCYKLTHYITSASKEREERSMGKVAARKRAREREGEQESKLVVGWFDGSMWD